MRTNLALLFSVQSAYDVVEYSWLIVDAHAFQRLFQFRHAAPALVQLQRGPLEARVAILEEQVWIIVGKGEELGSLQLMASHHHCRVVTLVPRSRLQQIFHQIRGVSALLLEVALVNERIRCVRYCLHSDVLRFLTIQVGVKSVVMCDGSNLQRLSIRKNIFINIDKKGYTYQQERIYLILHSPHYLSSRCVSLSADIDGSRSTSL
jgi:hypothetical protein